MTYSRERWPNLARSKHSKKGEPQATEIHSIIASARPSEALNGAAGQLLRSAPAVPVAGGTPDDFIDLGGVISTIKSLSASVSNGLRSILKFGGTAFAASL